MSLYNKVRWILGITLVFALIITTNVIDKDSFERVKNSVESIYEDRLVAKEILLEMSLIIHEKEIAFFTQDSNFYAQRNALTNIEMEGLLEAFERTYLIQEEKVALNGLKEQFDNLVQLENEALTEQRDESTTLKTFKEIQKDLKELSSIQIKEGRRQVSISRKALETVALYSQLEIYFLIALALGVQFIVLYDPKPKS